MAELTRALGLVLALVITACASSNEAGWTGSNATPFDTAKARCEIETQST